METTRRELLGGVAAAALLSVASSFPSPAFAQTGTDFDIDAAFEKFMADIGGSAEDSGGNVTFTGRDPILRSHFRIGAAMALPAMAAAVGAAAIWKDRTGESQDVAIDLREAVYNVNPLMTPIMQVRLATGAVSPDDPVALGFTFTPTINGNLYQAPVGLGNPFSFVPFRTKDGRYMNITAAYPHLNTRALTLLNCRPTREAIAEAILTVEWPRARAGHVCRRRGWGDAPDGGRMAGPSRGETSCRHRPDRDPEGGGE